MMAIAISPRTACAAYRQSIVLPSIACCYCGQYRAKSLVARPRPQLPFFWTACGLLTSRSYHKQGAWHWVFPWAR
jgi:hypothetical protein